MPPKFENVEFRREYPGASVADHEMFMSFNSDSEALAFFDWWHDKGSSAFAKWLEKEKAKALKRGKE